MAFPKGFNITGIKGEDNKNLSLIYAPSGMKAAAVFTTNSNVAHPVEFSSMNMKSPLHRAVLVNKGIANAATGSMGKQKLDEIVNWICEELNITSSELLIASTGTIGQQLDITRKQIKDLVSIKSRIEPELFSELIMTTDTVPKTATRSFFLGATAVTIYGISKGSGMIMPNMATMLGFIMTDAEIDKETLKELMNCVNSVSFNCLNVDGETSTNDAVFLLSSGKAADSKITLDTEKYNEFYRYLKEVCIELVEKMARDGEGATKLVILGINGAENNAKAIQAARAISSSPLCKTAFHGASPNWGRIISALGASGVEVDIEEFDLNIDDMEWIKKGSPVVENDEKIRSILKKDRYKLMINLNNGSGRATVYTCDYSPEYISINAGYVS
ncbi:bifunctional glutamate N-acetyltransferase/amino-acid acetyltransferase ArgJ [Elusimicrobiota bacterium]